MRGEMGATDKADMTGVLASRQPATFRIARITVPLPSDWISKVPCNCRRRSRIPRKPTPVRPEVVNSRCFSWDIPLPLS